MKSQTAKFISQSFLRSFGTCLFTAFFIYILEIIFIVAFTALIYSGELSSQVPRALVFFITGDAILCIIVASLSSNPGAIAVGQDAPGAMLSVIAAGIIAVLSGTATLQFATVTMMIVITTLLTGLILVLLGAFRLGGLTRFLPYPVVGGFLAGSGWLLVRGGIGLTADVGSIAEAFRWNVLSLWIPGLILGILTYFVVRKLNKPYTIPVLMLTVSGFFYVVVWWIGVSIEKLQADGWLLAPYTSMGKLEFPFSPALLSQVEWKLLLGHLPALLPVIIISVVGLLLNASGMELITKREIDLNRELVMAGTANLAAGMVGGLAGFQDISFSTLNYVTTGGQRLVGILAGLLIGATIFMGMSVILYIPKFVFGAVLVYLGIELLSEWVYEAWFKFPRLDFFVIVTILITLAVRGVLEGVIVGLILAVFTFVMSYSRVNVIRFAYSGREYHSRVTRAPDEQQILESHGDELYIMKLEGYIFFGTANGIFEGLRKWVKSGSVVRINYCLLDFSKVTGIDSTGMLSFGRMMQWSQDQGIILVFTGLAEKTKKQFIQAVSTTNDNMQKFFVDADHGIEWCENEIIATNQVDLHIEQNLLEQLKIILVDENLERLIPYLQRRVYCRDEYLIREGETADYIYFIHSGQVTAQLESPGKNPVRLETIHSGRTVGEIAFFLGTRRTTSVIANQDTVVYSLSTGDLNRMEVNDPQSANLFHRLSVVLLSHRVMHLTNTMRALER